MQCSAGSCSAGWLLESSRVGLWLACSVALLWWLWRGGCRVCCTAQWYYLVGGSSPTAESVTDCSAVVVPGCGCCEGWVQGMLSSTGVWNSAQVNHAALAASARPLMFFL